MQPDGTGTVKVEAPAYLDNLELVVRVGRRGGPEARCAIPARGIDRRRPLPRLVEFRRDPDPLRLSVPGTVHRPGEILSLKLESETSPTTVLLTAEADGLLDHRVVRMTAPSESVSWTISDSFAPDTYIGAWSAREPHGSAHARVSVIPSHRFLDISARPLPGGRLELTVRDARGRPIAAEFVVAVGTKDTPPGEATALRSAFHAHRRWNACVSAFSGQSVKMENGDSGRYHPSGLFCWGTPPPSLGMSPAGREECAPVPERPWLGGATFHTAHTLANGSAQLALGPRATSPGAIAWIRAVAGDSLVGTACVPLR